MNLDRKPDDIKSRPGTFSLSPIRACQWIVCGRAGIVAPLLGLMVTGISITVRVAAGQERKPTNSQAPFELRVERNMVVVRVIVRDSNGHAVPGLRKEDFRLFDDNQPQAIDQFAVETSGAAAPVKLGASEQQPEKQTFAESAPANPTRHFQAFYFDDVEMQSGDVVRARNAADRYLAAELSPGDKAGIFTSSGKNVLDFTDDRAKLHQTLAKLRPRPSILNPGKACPDIGAYQAYLIVNHNREAIQLTTDEEIQCNCKGMGAAEPGCASGAEIDAETDGIRVNQMWETQFMNILRGLEQVIHRTALLPGQRSVIFISPGFLLFGMESSLDQITEDALRSSVVVNTLDPRGVYVLPLGDVTEHTSVTLDARMTGKKEQMVIDEIALNEQVLRNLPADTGGRFFHNNNDLDEGFRQVGTLTEVAYILAFSPHNLKFDGRFHRLKISLANPSGFTIQAARGYIAPTRRS